ncbi:hypothetical protein ABVT39_025033 [Epinephelus coioides]
MGDLHKYNTSHNYSSDPSNIINNYNNDIDNPMFSLNVVTYIVLVIGLPLTLVAICALFSQVRNDNVAPIYVINLLISDLIQFCCMIAEMVQPEDRVVLFIYGYSVFASVGFMVCIAMERYLVIVFPLWYRFRRTIKTSVMVCVVVWVLPLICTLPARISNSVAGVIILPIFLFLPLPLLIFFMGGTLRALSASISVPSDEKRRITGMLVLVLLIYILLFLPFIILMVAGRKWYKHKRGLISPTGSYDILRHHLESHRSQQQDFETFKWYLQGALKDVPAIPTFQLEHAKRTDTVDLMVHTYTKDTTQVARKVLQRLQRNDLVGNLLHTTSGSTEIIGNCQQKVKSNLKKKFQCLFETITKAGNAKLLNEIYTELYITEGGTAGVNDEHEVRQIETASRKPATPEATIRQEDMFKASPGRDKPIRTVMTKGVAGIGKTVLTQKFTLDWAEDKANQDILFTFPFTFRELNVLKEKKYSLVELVHHFFTETKEAGICRFEEFQVVFIFDGLDECRLPLDFHNNEILTDVTESTSVDVLLTNLIRGKLLPSARLWITTRPAAANQIPPDCVDMVTEVRGFTDPQKEEYFRKRFRKKQASRIISHIKTSRSLHIMCHIPVFCWITATILEDVMKSREEGELPKTLTEMYIHFLVVQTKVKNVKYHGKSETDHHWSPESREMIESLGKLAFDQLQKGNLIFYESDLTECGIDIRAASVYSGVFTQIFKEERGLYQDKVFCFVHLSIQEFLAALHVHLTFINSGVNLLAEEQSWMTGLWTSLLSKVVGEGSKPKQIHLYQSAVDKALQSPNGHLDLFLRFLLGLSLQTNQTLLRGLLTQTGSSSETNHKTVEHIKEKISENLSPERSINLFHCLNELNDRSLVKEIQQYLSSGRLSTDQLSPAQWSALGFILLSSEEDLDVFDLKKYSASEEALMRLLPVVKASNKAL